jgi:SAM-dependent methyltransferase
LLHLLCPKETTEVYYRLNQLKLKMADFMARRVDRNRFPKVDKTDIINALGEANGYSTYLEIASGRTGHKFGKISEKIFPGKKRLLYRVSCDYSDGLPLHYHSDSETGAELLKDLVDANHCFDVVFVDPHHSYEASKVNIDFAYRLIKHGGVMVIHDVNPPSGKVTGEIFANKRYWCGQTYQAFLDFIREKTELEYIVVDTDWGVGIVFSADGEKPDIKGKLPGKSNIPIPENPQWNFFHRYRKSLLRLISVRKFWHHFVC